MISNLAEGVDSFTSNAFLATGDRTALVDTGSNFDVVGAIRAAGADLDAVVLTHTHPDHVGNVQEVVHAFDVDVYGFDDSHAAVDRALEDEGTVRIGDHDYRVLHTPGHKNDHVCLYSEDASVLFAGDLVFADGSFGRTDLQEGDRPNLIDSIDRVLGVIDEDLSVMHTGHGPSVTADPYADVELALRAAKL